MDAGASVNAIEQAKERGSKCRSCDALVIWCVTESGKTMPVDRDPVENGNIRLEDRGKETRGGQVAPTAVYAQDIPLFGDTERHVSHYATCPDAKKWRRK